MNLQEKLLQWMKTGQGHFPETALQIFTHQFTKNPPYRHYCQALNKTPENITTWQEIPAIPTDTFKIPEIPLRCFPENQITGHFLTSGTTQETKGKHQHRSLDLYKTSILSTWRHLNLPKIHNPHFFSPTLEENPHSSLIQMFATLDTGGQWISQESPITAFHPSEPTAILGTSIALLKACQKIPPTKLPPNSWILETGGSKGLTESFTPQQVLEKLSTHLGIPHSHILNEYSMTELSSQFYKWGNQKTHKGPPWTAIRILDLETGNPAPLGKIGYLEIIDLANLDTVSAIRTQDLAIATGHREFQLIGRDPAAIARGCSRTS